MEGFVGAKKWREKQRKAQMAQPLLCSSSDTIKIWDIEKDSPLRTCSPHSSTINCVSWNHSNQVIASGCDDGKIALSHSSGAFLGSLPEKMEEGPVYPINSICFSSGSRYIATGGGDGMVKIWDLKKKEVIKSFQTPSAVICVQWGGVEGQLASGTTLGEIRLHSLVTGQSPSLRPFTGTSPSDPQAVKDIKFSPFKKTLLAACNDSGSVELWDTRSGKSQGNFSTAHFSPASMLAFSPVNQLLLASAGLDKRILFYDITEKKIVKTITASGPLTCLQFHENGSTLAAGSSLGTISIFDLRTSTGPVKILDAHSPRPVMSLHFQNRQSGTPSGVPKGPTTPATDTDKTFINPTPLRTAPKPPKPSGGVFSTEISPEFSSTPSVLPPRAAQHMSLFSPLKGISLVLETYSSAPSQRSQGHPLPSSSFSTSTKIFDRAIPRSISADLLSPPKNEGKEMEDNAQNESLNESKKETQRKEEREQIEQEERKAKEEKEKKEREEKERREKERRDQEEKQRREREEREREERERKEKEREEREKEETYESEEEEIQVKKQKERVKPLENKERKPPVEEANEEPTQNNIPTKSSQHTESAVPQNTAIPHRPKESKPADGVLLKGFERPPLSSIDFHSEVSRHLLEDTLQTFQQSLHQDIQNLHIELIKQFHLQQNKLITLLEKYCDNRSLLEEIKELREENKRLKNLYQ